VDYLLIIVYNCNSESTLIVCIQNHDFLLNVDWNWEQSPAPKDAVQKETFSWDVHVKSWCRYPCSFGILQPAECTNVHCTPFYLTFTYRYKLLTHNILEPLPEHPLWSLQRNLICTQRSSFLHTKILICSYKFSLILS
jgi:hypothetical protein